MADVFCNKCGHRNQEGSNFCSSCGQPLERATEEPSTITYSLEQATSPDDVEVDLDLVGPGGALVATRGPNSGARGARVAIVIGWCSA